MASESPSGTSLLPADSNSNIDSGKANPAMIAAFDQAMRGLIRVPKSDISTSKPKKHKPKK